MNPLRAAEGSTMGCRRYGLLVAGYVVIVAGVRMVTVAVRRPS